MTREEQEGEEAEEKRKQEDKKTARKQRNKKAGGEASNERYKIRGSLCTRYYTDTKEYALR